MNVMLNDTGREQIHARSSDQWVEGSGRGNTLCTSVVPFRAHFQFLSLMCLTCYLFTVVIIRH